LDDIIKLTIDDEEVEARKGMTVLEAADEAGFFIPTLCSDPDMKPYGACRLCVVEIEGMRGFPTACTTPVTDGMVVRTESPGIERVRRLAVELIRTDHPTDCNACPKNHQCDLQMMEALLDITEMRFHAITKELPIDESNPFFNLDRNYCVLCGKCVRSCDEIRGVGAIALASRGYDRHVATFGDGLLIDSNCESCGECVDHCPVYAFNPKDTRKPTQEVETICPYCGVGCGISLGIRHDEVVSAHGIKESPVNEGNLCVKGRFSIPEFVHHSERLKTPLVRRNGELSEATWDEALDLVAEKLAGYKGDEVAVIPSDKCTNEDNYVLQKFARVALGTNNINHCGGLCQAPGIDGLVQSFGSGAMTNSINEIRDAACILAIGTDTTASHPIIGLRIKKAAREGAKLIVANPREIDLVRFADLWLRYNPGTEVALLMGIMRVIVDEGLLDSSFIEERCENFDAFKESLSKFDLDFVEKTTGVSREQIAGAARVYAGNAPAMIVYGEGIIQSSHGTDNVIAAANLAMLTGNIGKPSTGVNPLWGQNNEQGACDMGALSNAYTGYQAVDDPAVKEKFESAWGCTLNPSPGLTVPEILRAAFDGQVKALYLVGENLVLSEPDVKHTREALANLEFLVVQDIFLSETAQLAHVVLPAASFAEKDGTFTNTERRVQRIRKAAALTGSSKPDWWITCQLGQKAGSKGFDFTDPSQIMEEIASLTPSYGGISYERLENGGLQWPCPTQEHPGTPVLYTEAFTRGRGRFMPLEYKPPAELPDASYPLILTTGPSLFHFHTGTRTRKVKGLNILQGEDLVGINPENAQVLGIADGDAVKVVSPRGEVVAKVKVTGSTPVGTVFMTLNFAESPTNLLTNPALDPVSRMPEYQYCAVRVEKSAP